MGFGVGFFISMLYRSLSAHRNITIEGCEPAEKNYHFYKTPVKLRPGIKIKTYNKTFLATNTTQKFNFITAIYVFPHFVSEDLEATVQKINLLLKQNGKFILVVANEAYLKEKLRSTKDLFIEKTALIIMAKNTMKSCTIPTFRKLAKILIITEKMLFTSTYSKTITSSLSQKKF
jgi:cyclopropane fatty-acyl-phospholipid synthase-like methyltransferase